MSSLPLLQLLVLERVDRAKNFSRFYVLSVTPSLFGGPVLTREWGRIGRLGRRSITFPESPAAAGLALDEWLRKKTKRGYVIAHSQSNNATKSMPSS